MVPVSTQTIPRLATENTADQVGLLNLLKRWGVTKDSPSTSLCHYGNHTLLSRSFGVLIHYSSPRKTCRSYQQETVQKSTRWARVLFE